MVLSRLNYLHTVSWNPAGFNQQILSLSKSLREPLTFKVQGNQSVLGGGLEKLVEPRLNQLLSDWMSEQTRGVNWPTTASVSNVLTILSPRPLQWTDRIDQLCRSAASNFHTATSQKQQNDDDMIVRLTDIVWGINIEQDTSGSFSAVSDSNLAQTPERIFYNSSENNTFDRPVMVQTCTALRSHEVGYQPKPPKLPARMVTREWVIELIINSCKFKSHQMNWEFKFNIQNAIKCLK